MPAEITTPLHSKQNAETPTGSISPIIDSGFISSGLNGIKGEKKMARKYESFLIHREYVKKLNCG